VIYEQQSPLKPVPDRRKAPSPRRRSVRAELEVPVVVRLTAKDGSPQEEATHTKVVNAHGCLLLLKAVVVEGLSIELINPDTNEVRRGRVVFCGAVDSAGRTQVGVELEDPDPKFWGQRYVDFLLWEACRPP